MQIKQSSLLPLKKVMGRGCGVTLPSSPATVLPERANPGGVHPTRQKSPCCAWPEPIRPLCGQKLAFVSWMAIKGTENICITNAFLC